MADDNKQPTARRRREIPSQPPPSLCVSFGDDPLQAMKSWIHTSLVAAGAFVAGAVTALLWHRSECRPYERFVRVQRARHGSSSSRAPLATPTVSLTSQHVHRRLWQLTHPGSELVKVDTRPLHATFPLGDRHVLQLVLGPSSTDGPGFLAFARAAAAVEFQYATLYEQATRAVLTLICERFVARDTDVNKADLQRAVDPWHLAVLNCEITVQP